MTLAIVIPTYRGGPASESTWDDLRVCLASIASYARGFEVVVAWDGPCEPDDLPRNPLMRLIERPKGMPSGTATYWALTQHSDATNFVTVSDDVVLMPDTLVKLFEDAATLHENGHQVGILACRSNFAPGPQNIRAANGSVWTGAVDGYDSENTILTATRVSPFCAFSTRQALMDAPPANVEWYNDDLACFDLRKAGYTNAISRAYVHHIGMRSSAASRQELASAMRHLNDDALAWIQTNRPDFWQYLQTTRHAVA